MHPQTSNQDDLQLFQAYFDQLLNPNHPLMKLAGQIDWHPFDAVFADCFCDDNGAPTKATRLMVGLHYLKHTFNESDESVVDRWVENPYWQSFCGYTHMQHHCPIYPTTMTKWRNRVGAQRIAQLLTQTVSVAVKTKRLPKHELQQVNIDTTVQEKNITPPTDSKLLYKAIVKLVDAAKARDITLRQSYLRVGKRAAVKASRYAHAKQFKRMQRQLRRLRTWVGRLIRDIDRKFPRKFCAKDESLKALMNLCERLRQQKRQDKNKIYSLHELDVCCISKGKANKRYEFGQKIAVATTNRGNWFVGSLLVEANPYDGHTLSRTLMHVESITGEIVRDAYVDRGYRGHKHNGEATIHLAGSRNKHLTRLQRCRRKRRSAVEPKIGHAKSDHRMGQCYLKGLTGDAINAILAAAGSNLIKLLRLLPCAQAVPSWK